MTRFNAAPKTRIKLCLLFCLYLVLRLIRARCEYRPLPQTVSVKFGRRSNYLYLPGSLRAEYDQFPQAPLLNGARVSLCKHLESAAVYLSWNYDFLVARCYHSPILRLRLASGEPTRLYRRRRCTVLSEVSFEDRKWCPNKSCERCLCQ